MIGDIIADLCTVNLIVGKSRPRRGEADRVPAAEDTQAAIDIQGILQRLPGADSDISGLIPGENRPVGP
ncbi:hypothetical protein D3C73_1061810 [compost metagenome]